MGAQDGVFCVNRQPTASLVNGRGHRAMGVIYTELPPVVSERLGQSPIVIHTARYIPHCPAQQGSLG